MNASVQMNSAPAPLDELCKGRLDVAIAAGFNNNQLLSDRIRRGLHISSLPLGFRSVRFHDHRNRGCLRHQLAQQLQPLRP
jgi:hypothetical protein